MVHLVDNKDKWKLEDIDLLLSLDDDDLFECLVKMTKVKNSGALS